MTINRKLTLSFWLMALLIISVGFAAVKLSTNITKSIRKTEEEYGSFLTEEIELSNHIRRGEGYLMLYLALHNKADKDKFSKSKGIIKKQISRLDESVKIEEGRTFFRNIKSQSTEFINIADSLIESHDKDIANTGKFNLKDYEVLINRVHFLSDNIQEMGIGLARFNINRETLAKVSIIENASHLQLYLILIMISSVILAVFLAYFISKSISGPIESLKHAAVEIGKGKLDTKVEIKSKDELKILADSINKTTENLSKTLVSKEYLNNIIRSMNDTLVIINTDASIKMVNQAMLDLLGYNEHELVGKPIGILFEEKDTETDKFRETKLEKLIENGEIRNYETKYQTKGGDLIPVIFSGSVMKDKDGEVSGIIGVAKEIRKRKRVEEMINRVNECLLSFGSDADDNIKKIVETAGSIFNGTCALYNKEEGELLSMVEGWNVPEDLERSDKKEGHICYDVITKYKDSPFVINDLDKSNYAQTDPNVLKYKLKTYIGCAVKIDQNPTGSLCVVNQENRTYSKNELMMLSILSDSLGIEEERKIANERILASLKEKEVLLGEIHHRVKNNLQVVSSLLRLQSRHIKDEKIVDIFNESQGRIKTMSLIHEKLYGSKDLANIDFKEYVSDLMHGLFRSYGADLGTMKLNIDIRDVFFEIDTAIPLGLVINELVSNSLKHAFPKGRSGEVKVAITESEDEIELLVRDTGIGFPEGLDFRNSESLGLQLVNSLVNDQLNGKIELDQRAGTGFSIKFRRGK